MFTKRQKVIIITLVCLIISGIVGFGTAIFLIEKNKNGSKEANNSNNFETYLNGYKASFQNYILGSNEGTYKDLIAQSEQAINSKDDAKILELKPKLKELEDKVTTENTNALNTSLEQLKTIDISKLPEDKKKNITSLINEISTTIGAKNFVKANSNIEQTKATIFNELKANEAVEAAKIAEEIKNKAVTLETAKELIFKEDSNFANKQVSSGSILSKGTFVDNLTIYKVNESVYHFIFNDPKIIENDGITSFYYVGKDSGNVYRCSSVGGAGGDLYLIQNNRIIKTFKYIVPTNNTSSSSEKLSANDALKILQKAYPDYTYIDGGNIENGINDEVTGKDRPAYIFKFAKNSNNDTYVGFVFFDGSYKFRRAWKPD